MLNIKTIIKEERRRLKKENFNISNSINSNINNTIQISVEGKTVLIQKNGEALHFLGCVFGGCFVIKTILGYPVYIILKDNYADNKENPKFEKFINCHEQGHIAKNHLDIKQNICINMLYNLQTLMGIGKGIQREFEADEYAADIIGYKTVLDCLIFMKNKFYFSNIQFLQFNARIKNIKRKMA